MESLGRLHTDEELPQHWAGGQLGEQSGQGQAGGAGEEYEEGLFMGLVMRRLGELGGGAA